MPASAAHAARIPEIIDAHEARRQAGRAGFASYRDRGVTPATHNLAAEDAREPCRRPYNGGLSARTDP